MSVRILESVTLVTLISFLLKWGVSLFPYSGAGKPPMYGDYEAQRHWQEITLNLDVKKWYTHSKDNDLMYWGLDYPPLTAYHSYVIGLVGHKINPNYVQLNKSRGYESYDHKLFMRYSVFFSDLLIYIPAVFLFLVLSNANLFTSKVGNQLNFIALTLCPSLILIDYGHFQYNNVSLGFFIAAVAAVSSDYDCIGSILFSLALNYKQMELYHALPIFFFLLSKCFQQESFWKSIVKLCSIGASVILTFLIIWAPYCTDFETFSQVLLRIFPLNRGLFEDKVASIWCSLSILIKLKSLFEQSTMALICLISTCIACLPSCITLFKYPTHEQLKYSLVNVGFAFFLFSYHVHEKSILLVLIPSCFIFSHDPHMVLWFHSIAQFSMLPLLDKDGLFIPFVSLTTITFFFMRYIESFCAIKNLETFLDLPSLKRMIFFLFRCSILGAIALTVAFKLVTPPSRYPDLFPVLISLYSCAHFFFFAIFFNYRQISVNKEFISIKNMKVE